MLRHKSVRRNTLTDDALRAKMTARGAPERAASLLLGLYLASRAGEFARIDPTLEQVLGRNPISLRSMIAQKIGG